MIKLFVKHWITKLFFSESHYGGSRLGFLENDLITCDGCGGYFSEPYLDRTKDLCKKCGGDIALMGCNSFLKKDSFFYK